MNIECLSRKKKRKLIWEVWKLDEIDMNKKLERYWNKKIKIIWEVYMYFKKKWKKIIKVKIKWKNKCER